MAWNLCFAEPSNANKSALIINNKPDSKRQQTTTVDNKRLFNGFVLTIAFPLRHNTKQTTMEAQDNKTIEVPMGNTKEDITAREAIISDVYRRWYEANPSKAAYNTNLKDYINVRFLSINETIHHASMSYLSTLAVLQLDLILKTAHQVGKPAKPKPNNKNQADFSKILIMECPLIGIGTAKLTVGVKKKTGMKIQYCITAIET